MFKKIVLKNGLRLILVPKKESQSTTVLVLFGTGSKYETKNINGISHFLEHLFFKGTKKRPTALAVSKTLDRVGGQFNAFTDKEMTGYWAKVASEHTDLALDWVSDVLLNSKFDATEIDKERGVIIQEINMIHDTPMRYVGHLWEELLYGDQPAGWDVLGPKENIQAMSREQFLDYFKTHYRSGNALVCVAGKMDSGIKNKIEKYFGGLTQGRAGERLRVKEAQSSPQIAVYYKKTDQTHLCLGVRAYDLYHKDRYALLVLAALLGGMMSSRLFIAVRERRGLAYYVRTSVENYIDSGYLMTQAGLDNDKIDEAIGEILKQYRLARDKKIGAAEIAKAKDNLKGGLRLGLETSDQLASWVSMQEILKKEILTEKQVFDKIDKVTSTDLQRVARDIFRPDKLNLALIGPFKEKERFEKLLKL